MAWPGGLVPAPPVPYLSGRYSVPGWGSVPAWYPVPARCQLLAKHSDQAVERWNQIAI